MKICHPITLVRRVSGEILPWVVAVAFLSKVMTYREQIRSPQWITFAAKLKEEAGWKCEACGVSQGPNSELTIHHVYYISRLKAWEYPKSLLECLCWKCHKERQLLQEHILSGVASFLRTTPTAETNMKGFCEAFPGALSNYAAAQGYSPEPEEAEPKPSTYPDMHKTKDEWEAKGGAMDPADVWSAVVGCYQGNYWLGDWAECCEGVARKNGKLTFGLMSDGSPGPFIQPGVRQFFEESLTWLTGEPSTFEVIMEEYDEEEAA